MSPWLFNVYMDSIIREFKRECVEEGLNLKCEKGGESMEGEYAFVCG